MRERGATLAEYALLVGLIAVVAIGALTVLGRNSSDQVDDVADHIDTPDASGGGGGEAGSGGGGGGSGDGGAGTTTTTAPPTTAPPTTAPPTTAPPTTTVPTVGPPFPSTSGFAPADVEWTGSDWSATAGLVVRDTDGTPLPATTATVDIWRHTRTWSGWTWRRRTVTVTTGADGTVPVETLEFPSDGWGEVDRLVFDLIDVDHTDWDGTEDRLDFTP